MANVSMVGHCETTILTATVVITTASILIVELVVALAVWAWRKRYARLNIDQSVTICALRNTITEKDAADTDRDRIIKQQDDDIHEQRLRTSLKEDTAVKQQAMMRIQADEESSRLHDQLNRLNIDHSVTISALMTTITEKDAVVRDRDRTIEQQDHDIQTLRASLEEATEARQQATMRLSEVAAARLTDNNPAIVDLSDSFRPTRLGDMMSELYDNQWTSAFSALETRHGPRPEEGRDYVNTLLAILRAVFEMCSDISEQRMAAILQNYCSESADLPRDIRKRIKDDRKKVAQLAIPQIKEDVFAQLAATITDPVDLFHHPEVREYAGECVNICWMMCVQDPPMALADLAPESSRYDPSLYREYTCRGPYVAFTVWPAVLIQAGGAVVTKGTVQCYKTQPGGDTGRLDTPNRGANLGDMMFPSHQASGENLV